VTDAAVPANRRRGRPADPDLVDRVYRAALAVYAEVGWSGFTIDAVAARASVGKASIYQRWPDKQQVLVGAFLAVGPESFPMDLYVGDIRKDLIAYVESVVEAISGPSGLLHIRVQLEAKSSPDVLGVALDHLQNVWFTGARRMVAEAIARGELPEGTSTSLLFDIVRGATINRFLALPPNGGERFRARKHDFAVRVVDVVLAGIRAVVPQPVAAD
jgi:AcrR family transcriptional regulator